MAKTYISSYKKNARKRKATIMFEDEAFFQQEGTTRQSWARRGNGFTVLRHPCKRKSKFYGAISVEEEPEFFFQKAMVFNGKTFQKFLELLLEQKERVCLILDNARYHHARLLKSFLKKNRKRLWLYFLPPYSPELNAIETVWRETRRDSTHNRYFSTQKGLTRAVQTQFRVYQKVPSLLSGIIAPFL